jgi:glycine/D-amino acid oxidase-like deaminating enzyme
LTESDSMVIGGGVVGLGVAYGLARKGQRVRLIDGADDAYRASRGNFGLVWVQGKGADHPGYGRWSMDGASAWPALAQDLLSRTGVDVQLRQPGGLSLCLSQTELAQRVRGLQDVQDVIGRPYPFSVLDAAQVRALEPRIGKRVVGAVICPLDGHVSPLKVMHAFSRGLASLGVQVHAGRHVDRIEHRAGQFHVQASNQQWAAGKLVLAAGLGNRTLAPWVGLHAPVSPVRGQLLVTERLQPFLHHPCLQVRQTDEGVVQIGDTREEVGFDDSTTHAALAAIARRAVACFPHLADANVVRSWGSLRVMTPDGNPIYEESPQLPGAFLVSSHSGITLAPMHVGALADWMCGAPQPADVVGLSGLRFDV